MPRVTVVNDTNVPLHIALRHISPIHFVNNVPPGGEAVFKVGRVWFTVEARIARGASGHAQQSGTDGSQARLTDQQSGQTKEVNTTTQGASKKEAKQEEKAKAKAKAKAKENNEYTMFQSVAAPVAVSVAALSLGAGAIYVGMAASAAGGMSAALSTISAQVTSAAASQAPTAHRLYRYAKKGQKVVQIGQVLGIGGGALLGSRAAKGHVDGQTEHDEQTSGQVSKKDDDELVGAEDMERIKRVKQILMDLVEHSAVKSHGWYMNGERTIRIKGGPRAAEVEEWLIIETDTVAPFSVVSDDPNDKPDPDGQQKAMAAEQQASSEATQAEHDEGR